MRTTNTTKKWPKDLIEATNIIEIQKSISLTLALGKACKIYEVTKHGNSQEIQREYSVHEFCSLLFLLQPLRLSANFLNKNNLKLNS